MIREAIRRGIHLGSRALGLLALASLSAGTALANGGGGGGGGGNVPEIDPASAVSAMTLLGGGILLAVDRVRKGRSRS